MKKLNVQSVFLFFISVLLFVSCMGPGKNTESGYAVGVVRFDMKTFQNVLDVDDVTSFYNIKFTNTSEGACFIVVYEIDYDAPENSYESILANGFITVSILESKELDQFNMLSSITDTSKVLSNELHILDPIIGGEFYYVKGMGFFSTALEIPPDQKMYFILSCNMQDEAKIDNGQRVYDVFLRTTIDRASSKTPEKTGILNAYNMKYFMEKFARDEKALGNTTIRLRFNYASAIKDDQITWSQQISNEIFISSILSDN